MVCLVSAEAQKDKENPDIHYAELCTAEGTGTKPLQKLVVKCDCLRLAAQCRPDGQNYFFLHICSFLALLLPVWDFSSGVRRVHKVKLGSQGHQDPLVRLLRAILKEKLYELSQLFHLHGGNVVQDFDGDLIPHSIGDAQAGNSLDDRVCERRVLLHLAQKKVPDPISLVIRHRYLWQKDDHVLLKALVCHAHDVHELVQDCAVLRVHVQPPELIDDRGHEPLLSLV
mmetsp:Transcript_11978/g.33115  ORF Transcript_11978/g.33115 Transcript_11978/m.33115 type:complete len:227 (-) Transcript_11978:105-785(-)